MITRLLSADLLKMRRKAIWFLIFLGPVGIITLEAVNFGLRYDYLTGRYANDLWRGLTGEIQFLVPITLLLGITIVASMIANIEHQTHAWKQLLALPISRADVFFAKFALCVMLLCVSCLLLAVGTIGLGIALRFGADFSLSGILQMSFYPFIAALPIVALQIWLSVTMRNQAVPLTFGIVGAVFSPFSMMLPDWLLWKWPLLAGGALQPEHSVYAGAAAGAVILAVGIVHFTRKDVD
ncbi:ABC transporter permease [Paenibacillus thalictri]|uniref:Permease n=1 Tax=Paenibacillus thalictri TaxID=2527873 RepID=A0A4Q9DSU1_9BACL|nr:ABC transporter permease [Paenibacillus thalictri]TBL79967.1 permease [Paenibacillus thalictri]